jgi:hypothetical protein
MAENAGSQVGLRTQLEGGSEVIFVFGSLFQAKAMAAAPPGGNQMDLSSNVMILLTPSSGGTI